MITTKRLHIRPFQRLDLDRLLDIYNCSENMAFIPNANRTWTRDELLDKYKSFSKFHVNGYGLFVVEEKYTGLIIGEAGLFNSLDDELNLELGYIIDRQFWRKGFGEEVCNGLIKHAFEALKVCQIRARMYADNKASVCLAEKCGLVLQHEENTKNGLAVLQYGKERSN